jgi:hypothetical protein
MIEFLEKQRGLKVIPPSYDTTIILETSFRNRPIAKGRLIPQGFIVFEKSLIRKKTNFRDNPGVPEIRDFLLTNKRLIDCDETGYYSLTEDVLLSSSSTASRFVHGNGRNGDKDWKYSGKMLSELLNSNY